jgi:hypothetical protein
MSGLLLDIGGAIFIGIWLGFLWRLFCRSQQSSPALRILCVRFFFTGFILALIAELTIFNWPYYLNLWADESTIYSAKDFEIQENDAESLAETGIKIKALDRKITSLYIDLPFREKELQHLRIIYKDEESTRRHNVTLYRFSPRSRYVAILSHGKVSEVGVYSDEAMQIDGVTLNPRIPVKILLLRIMLLGVLLFMGGLWLNRKTKDKLRFFLFDCPADATNKEQNKLYWAMVFSMIVFCLFTVVTGWMAMKDAKTDLAARQGMQNIYPLMADALLKGQLHLELEVSPELLNSARPYDPADRGLNDITEYADFSYYEGKYYSYFGIVPVLMLFAPFKLLTGYAFPTHIGVFIFSAMTCLAFALLWREIVRRFMPHMPFFFYCLGGLSLIMISCIPCLCRHPVAYELAIAAGLMFLALGLFLFIRAFTVKKNFCTRFFFASLSFALAVGCRPTAVFMFLLALVFAGYGIRYLQTDRTQASRFLSAKFVLICLVLPYTIVALPLMAYNYARFGSITDFGAFHQLTLANMKALSLANPVGKLLKILYAFQAYLFNPLEFHARFPFMRLMHDFVLSQRYDATLPVYMFNGATVGLINLPVLWFLFNIRSVGAALRTNDAMLYRLLLLLLGIGLLHIFFISLNAGVLIRYSVDFLWIFTLAALICAYFTYQIHIDNAPLAKNILKFFYVACAVSIVFCFFLSFISSADGISYNLTYGPVYYYLQSLFSI